MVSCAEEMLLMVSLPLYAVIILTEMVLSNWQLKHFYSWRETMMNVYMTLLNMSVDVLFRGCYLMVLFVGYQHRLFDPLDHVWLYWICLFLLEDFAFYIEHLVDHSSRLFWAVHVTHHSSTEFNLTTGFRSSVLQPLYRFVFFLPIVFLGFKPMDILLIFSVTQIYGILVHTQFIRKMPHWFESVFVSPSHHRVHHASNLIYLDRNMGMVLIIWDKLFGTFQQEQEDVPPVFGVTKMPEKPFHPVHGITHEFEQILADVRKAPTFTEKLGYVFMPPGWSHDGSTQTTRALQREHVRCAVQHVNSMEPDNR